MRIVPVFACGIILALGPPVARAQHDKDMWLGRVGGAVAWSPSGLKPGTVYQPLSRVDTFLHGWSNNNPGFDHAITTAGSVSPLPAGAQIWLEVVELDPAFFAIDNSLFVMEMPEDATLLGGSTLHQHITWFIDQTDTAFNANQCVWEATFKFFDQGSSGLLDSQPFTLLFSNVPVRGGEFPQTNTPASGDFDVDRDVDAVDAAAFGVCMAGPRKRPAPNDPSITTCEVKCYNAFDFDDDMDNDLLDFAEFQVAFSP